jgi:hypothetical protein
MELIGVSVNRGKINNNDFVHVNFFKPNGRLFSIFFRVGNCVFSIKNPFHKWDGE